MYEILCDGIEIFDFLKIKKKRFLSYIFNFVNNFCIIYFEMFKL